MDEEKYTLKEARQKIARDECANHGHDLSVEQIRRCHEWRRVELND